MPPDLIHVRPTPELRRDFAEWAVAQVPKVRTVSSTVFAVPAALFTDVPERLLIGSLVDGHRYISPDEDQQQAAPGSAGDDLLGVYLPEREAVPGEPLPELPDEAYAPDATPLDATPADDGSDESDQSDRTADTGKPTCADCGRPFKSDRALNSHRRQAHPED
ncbi:hypothetical protein ACFY64_32000 [Streptomyces collinus]|uniref:hypothetical protein n=1 Tax=Streptomyces collinus TaxID=42684 RepID=UPI0036B75EFE